MHAVNKPPRAMADAVRQAARALGDVRWFRGLL
jgi:flavin-binding protein dodecin